MLYNQPLAIRFGNELGQSLDDARWKKFDIAVAWVRASGIAHLSEAIARFLQRGGRLSIVVGIDLQNTTFEGLQALLALEKHGNAETFVHYNEANGVFHPKLYLFRDDTLARLIVGSNNLTASGLYINVEAGLKIDMAIDDGVVKQTLDSLTSWKDVASGLAHRLDNVFLDQLVAEGYVDNEGSVRSSRRRRITGKSGAARNKLFASRPVAPPPLPTSSERTKKAPAPTGSKTATAAPSARAVGAGTVVLMRLRKAHATDRPTQTQIPLRLSDTGFFGGTANVISVHSGEPHGIHEASARGGRNTLKLEVPEMRNFVDPVARFEQTSRGIFYEVYDVGTPHGDQIMLVLNAGRADGSTQLTVPGNPDIATWWRFI